ncbi:hypothetical protein SCT_1279 [Sulfuricella sp. T08]|uniref:hypothetical protein n=1 Tax=Sulfuricella sp. T08 TaxID=1632857 RepID=UPI0006179CA5|nr:hypothetical protein [Sulfuricella sp. T08]GAO35883.1 hypothetical protein SCT_1279 [Sulfuricella sp. T08]
MEKSANHSFYIGSAGWEHPQWEGCFYPDGMPPEWRLTFYNTAFPCVYLAYGEWSGLDLQTLNALVEDTLARFRFVLEPNPAGLSDGDRARLEVLAPRIDPFGGQVVWLEGKLDLKRLAGDLKKLAESTGPVYLISRDHDLAAMNQVKTLLEIMGL